MRDLQLMNFRNLKPLQFHVTGVTLQKGLLSLHNECKDDDFYL
jgi:hypothetical protein